LLTIPEYVSDSYDDDQKRADPAVFQSNVGTEA